ncbi:MAG: hypothetical protein V7634_4213 [Bradyrhizobium sp.]|jgi:hypothetical protein|nr:hypothetical protein [Bradyrhizobium sp.]
MKPAPSPLLPRKRAASALLSLALILSMSAPLSSFAQDTGTSGIPSGPANINGLNGVLRDPSGIGNAARIPSPPPPDLSPRPVPDGVPLTSTRPAYTPRVRSAQRWQHLSKRQRQRLERAAVKENDRLLSRGVTSICRGC